MLSEHNLINTILCFFFINQQVGGERGAFSIWCLQSCVPGVFRGTRRRELKHRNKCNACLYRNKIFQSQDISYVPRIVPWIQKIFQMIWNNMLENQNRKLLFSPDISSSTVDIDSGRLWWIKLPVKTKIRLPVLTFLIKFIARTTFK